MKTLRTRSSLLLSLLAMTLASPAGAEPLVELASRPLPGLRAEVAALLLRGRPGGAFAMGARALPRRDAEGVGIELQVELDGAGLLHERTEAARLEVELYAYALDAAGAVAGHLARVTRVELEDLGAALYAGGLRLAGGMALAPGDYQLRVLVSEPASQRFALGVLPLSLSDPGVTTPAAVRPLREQGAAWIVPRIDAPAVAGATRDDSPARPETRPSRRRKGEIARLASGYRAVLETLAGGSAEEALAALQVLESDVAARDLVSARELLIASQEELVERLARHDAECLVPVVLLHLDLHDRYVAARQFPLASIARERVVALAERYAALAADALGPSLAAQALTSMGAYLLGAELRNPGRELLARALELDPLNGFARLDLGVAFERLGDYPAVVETLRPLVENEPRADEARLRLALNLRRVGAAEEAVRLLRRLIDDGRGHSGRDDHGIEPWLLAIAYQELARVELDRERPQRAVELLEEAIRRLPGNGRLELLLAYALDRVDEPARAREVLARRSPADDQPSPRHRYNRRPGEAREHLRRSLARASAGRLPALARALEEGRAK